MTLKELKLASNDERGYTAEYDQQRTGTQIILFRKENTVSGRHYHKGLSATKNPEILMLLKGECTLNWFDINKEDKTPSTITLTGPIQIEVPAYTWHEVITITDCVFIEFNSIAEHIADTFYLPAE